MGQNQEMGNMKNQSKTKYPLFALILMGGMSTVYAHAATPGYRCTLESKLDNSKWENSDLKLEKDPDIQDSYVVKVPFDGKYSGSLYVAAWFEERRNSWKFQLVLVDQTTPERASVQSTIAEKMAELWLHIYRDGNDQFKPGAQPMAQRYVRCWQLD